MYVSTAVRREQEPCYKHNQYAEKERKRETTTTTAKCRGSFPPCYQEFNRFPYHFAYCRPVLRQLLVKISRGRTWEHRPLTACLYFDRAHLEINRHSFRASGITICLYYPRRSNGRCECRSPRRESSGELRVTISTSPWRRSRPRGRFYSSEN